MCLFCLLWELYRALNRSALVVVVILVCFLRQQSGNWFESCNGVDVRASFCLIFWASTATETANGAEQATNKPNEFANSATKQIEICNKRLPSKSVCDSTHPRRVSNCGSSNKTALAKALYPRTLLASLSLVRVPTPCVFGLDTFSSLFFRLDWDGLCPEDTLASLSPIPTDQHE